MRYLPLTDADRRAMLAAIGASSIDELVPRRAESAPALDAPVDLPHAQGEIEVERALAALAGARTSAPARCRSSAAPAPIAITSRRRSII